MVETKAMEKVEKDKEKLVAKFLKELDIDEASLLAQIKDERARWDDYVQWAREEIEADLILLRNQKKQKGKIGDTTLFNVHSALVARSYQNKSNIKFKGDKNWIEREIKMLNNVWSEDNQTPYMKALRYWQYFDKYATWVTISAKIGWDWVYKRNIFQTINPLLAVPDPDWDYFSWNYRYIWFTSIKTDTQLEQEWYDVDDITIGESAQWAINQKINSQWNQGLNALDTKWLHEVYLHFTHIGTTKVWVLTCNNETKILSASKVLAGNKYEEKNPEAIKFPLSFKYRKPLRDNFFWDRPANYARDVQIQKAIIANLRLDKMRAELYPMYLYNKDYVSGKDLAFGFNKGIGISPWPWNAWVNLQNLVSPVQKDLRIDTSIQVEQLMDRQVEKSTSIWEVAQWTTPTQRETLWTNQLVSSNTDINLSLNEELDLIGEEQFVQIWFAWYYQNFTDADKKLIYAWSWTWVIPLNLKRKDFIYEWNLAISTESNAESETRKRKKALAYLQTWPIILQDQSINEWSKRETLRRIAEANWLDQEDIDIEIPKTAQQKMQSLENELLNDWEYIEINPDDDDEQHLLEMWSLVLTPEAEMHQYSHIKASIQKGQMANQSQNAGMLNSMSNIASAQTTNEMTQLK